MAASGTLLKAGAHTGLLKSRYVVLDADAQLRYWESERGHRDGGAPRGGGEAIAAEEWWPRRSTIEAVPVKLADAEEYDGCTFLVHVQSADGLTRECWHLVAPSPAERLRWLTALVEAIAPSQRPPPPPPPPMATGAPAAAARGSDPEQDEA